MTTEDQRGARDGVVVRVLVLSDTHLRSGSGLPTAVLELAAAADHVVHGGDLVDLDVLDVLATLAPVTAVCGNVDDASVAARLDEHAQVELGGVRVGVVHDAGQRTGRHARLATQLPGCDVRVYGHSHEPEIERSTHEPGTWVVNPGSPTQRRRAPVHTVAWLELRDGEVLTAELVALDGAARQH